MLGCPPISVFEPYRAVWQASPAAQIPACSPRPSCRKCSPIHDKQASGTMTDTNSVIREKRGQALWITINRPDTRNGINADFPAGFARGYRDAHDDMDVRVIV